MPRIEDEAEIRRRLERERPWAVYALGDLAPGYREQSEWFVSEQDPEALALIYRAGEWPILFTLGEAGAVRRVLHELPPEPRVSLSIRPEHLPAVRDRWQVLHTNAMWRMVLDPAAPDPRPEARVEPILPGEADRLREMFLDGRDTGEEPDFFFPGMLADGTYYGIRDGDQWLAAAGTHLIAETEGVATIGNVYVRRDRRGAGLASAVVGAVVTELRRRGISTLALNVRQANRAALRVYERLGFRCYCEFTEGSAALKPE